MRNIRLVIQYDGTDYSGWQIQPNGASIQELIQNAIGELTLEKVKLIGSGRTDAGVHAERQIANFATSSTLPVYNFPGALNAKIPEDISVIHAEEVPMSFHARNSRYQGYQISFCRGQHGQTKIAI